MGKHLITRFEEHYMAVSVPAHNRKGFKIRYVYYAPWYVWDLEERELKRQKKGIGIKMLLSAVLFFLAALLDSEINRSPLMVIPGAVMLCAVMYEGIGAAQFLAAKYRTTESNFKEATGKIRNGFYCHAAALLAVVCSDLYLIMTGGFSLLNMITVLLYILAGCAAFGMRVQFLKIPVRKEKNDAMDKYEPLSDVSGMKAYGMEKEEDE